MKHSLNILFALLIVGLSFGQRTEEKRNTPDTEALIQSRNFEFVAESANPMRGRTVFLAPGYTLDVRPDTVISYLPYYGRAYQATMDPGRAGIKFTSTDFEYTEKPGKKRGWDIDIRVKDVQASPQLQLSVSENGQASLRFTSIDRQSISFHGYIREEGSDGS